MKNLFKSFLILSAIAMAIPCIAQTPNTLTKKEKKAGWELLFNGKDFSGWRQCNGTAMPANWVIEDNAMKVFTGEGKKPGQGANGDILYQNNAHGFAVQHGHPGECVIGQTTAQKYVGQPGRGFWAAEFVVAPGFADDVF